MPEHTEHAEDPAPAGSSAVRRPVSTRRWWLRVIAAALATALVALERRLGGPQAGERAVQSEYARQSSGNVTVGNIIRSLRRTGEIDWLDWFERERIAGIGMGVITLRAPDEPGRRAPDVVIEEITGAGEEVTGGGEDTEAGVQQFLVADPDGYLIRFQESIGRHSTR